MSDGIKIKDLNADNMGLPDTSHFEHGLVAKDGAEYSEYAHFVSDHHICEIFVGDYNWRDYGKRAARSNDSEGNPQSVRNEVCLVLEKAFNLGVQHKFKPLRSAGARMQIAAAVGDKAVSVVGGGAAAIDAVATGRTDLQLNPLRILNAQFYEESGSWDIPLDFTFRFGQAGLWDAKEEVFDPLIALLMMCTAVTSSEGHTLQYQTPGATLGGLLGGLGRNFVGDVYQDFGLDTLLAAITQEGTDRMLGNLNRTASVMIGVTYAESSNDKKPEDRMLSRNTFHFDVCYIEGIRVSFSEKKDLRGYPVQGNVSLTVKSMMPALGNNISNINDGQVR